MSKGKIKNNATLLYEKARSIAEHYGFISFQNIVGQAGVERGKKIVVHPPKDGVAGEADRPSIMKAHIDYNFSALPQPLMIYHSEPLPKDSEVPESSRKNAVQFSLEIIGSSKSIAEATLFKTTFAILRDLGFENFAITINSLGDRDSVNRFVREFTAYYRKRIEEVPTHCRSLLKKDVFKVLECAQDKCMLVKEQAPKPIATLTEESRSHFTEVLEFLESMDVPYTINNCLVGGKDFYTKTIFEVVSTESTNKLFPKLKVGKILARGGRYDDLAKKYGVKKEVPGVGISITFGDMIVHEMRPKRTDKPTKKPSVYLIHLGFSAKQQSLSALEILRKAKIPVYQSLSRDRISVQVINAEKMRVPYTIIIGQKEALEGTAIVRNMKNRSQETVLLPTLPEYLRSVR